MAKKKVKKTKTKETKKTNKKKSRERKSNKKENIILGFSVPPFDPIPDFSIFKKKTKKKKKKKKKGRKNRLKLIIRNKRFQKIGILAIAFLSFVIWLFWGVPLPTRLASDRVAVSTKLFDRNDQLIYEIYADKRSTPVDIKELPEYVWQSTIAIEDKDFYKHYGVSITGILRAAYKTVFKQKLEGGSTLTQQLVKNALLTPERTLKRKVRELALTIAVETIYSKDEILDLYLNQIPYGSTAYGIGAASELYFGKEAKELTLSEAALLAGLPAAPSRFSPFGSRPELAKGRQELVLSRMAEDGYISQEEADDAKEEELSFSEPESLKAPHFALWVKEILAEKYGESVVEKGGLRVKTTLDLSLQEFAQEKTAQEVGKLKDLDVGNGALIATRPQTGEILAMVGSKDYFAQDEDGKVNIIFAKRQPGSSIKPINYTLGLLDKKITPSTVLADVPTCFSVAGQTAYCPKNYSGGFRGGVQVRFALANSYNIPAVRVLALNGLERFVEFARDMGITTFEDPSNYGLSLTLGGGEVYPFDMAQAFGVLANEGVKQPLTPILEVKDWQGNLLEKTDFTKLEEGRVIPGEVSFLTSHILQDNNARSAAFGPSSELLIRAYPNVSVKTGTTNDLRDNWTIGYTKDALVAVWVGNNDNSPMSGAVSGVSGASPIWNAVMKRALENVEEGKYGDSHLTNWPRKPESVVGANICTTTGVLPEASPDAGCSVRYEYFLKDSIPSQIEGGFQDVHFDKTNGLFITEETAPENIEVRQHHVIFDPLGTFLCLDCPVEAKNYKSTIRYPLQDK